MWQPRLACSHIQMYLHGTVTLLLTGKSLLSSKSLTCFVHNATEQYINVFVFLSVSSRLLVHEISMLNSEINV